MERGEFKASGTRLDGSLVVDDIEAETVLATPGSQWRISSHDATQYGSRLLSELLPGRKFPFPKSLYAVEDALRFFVHHKPDAVILDFFGGSGTTAHAVARLNRQDGGRRRSITVTNNEVSADEAETLRRRGLRPGDPEWEALGIYEFITQPRITAAITGITPEGAPIKGRYKFTDESPMADGFPENVEFFRLDFLDPHEVSRGDKFEAILPLLWLMAGAVGERESARGGGRWFLPKRSPFAVLIREDEFGAFRRALDGRPDVRLVFLVTDSAEAFREMSAQVDGGRRCLMLYKSYLDNFRINRETAP